MSIRPSQAGMAEIEKTMISNIYNNIFLQYREILYHFGQNFSIQDEKVWD